MITLDYRLSAERNAQSRVDWASADQVTLRYIAFAGDQIFVVGGHDFSALWGWVTLLDFAAGLTASTRSLEMGNTSARFEFTESEAWLDFTRKGDRVVISANYVDETAEVPLVELSQAVEAHARRTLSDALARHPGLADNASFRTWFPVLVN